MEEKVKEICVKPKKWAAAIAEVLHSSRSVDTPICECRFKVKAFSRKHFFRFQKKNKVGKMCEKNKRLVQQLHQSPWWHFLKRERTESRKHWNRLLFGWQSRSRGSRRSRRRRRGLLGRYTPYKIAGGNASSLNSAQTCRNLWKSRQHAVSYFSTYMVGQKKKSHGTESTDGVRTNI